VGGDDAVDCHECTAISSTYVVGAGKEIGSGKGMIVSCCGAFENGGNSGEGMVSLAFSDWNYQKPARKRKAYQSNLL